MSEVRFQVMSHVEVG